MNRVIFVSDLELWSMKNKSGGPAFTKTIQYYIQEHWDVWLISDVVSNLDSTLLKKSHNIYVRPSIFKKGIHIRRLGLIFRILDHLIVSYRFIKTIREITENNSGGRTLLYSYEIFGIKACSMLSKTLKLPFVSRFQGTILSGHDNTIYNRIRFYPHYQALSEPASLVVMTNDGTQGKEILRKLGNNSKTMFLMNGLDLMEKDLSAFKLSFHRSDFRRKLFPNIGDEECIFLTVSRLEGWKRLDRAIDGFADYCRANKRGKLCIVGDGSERVPLEERAKGKGIFERVKFVGAVQHDEVYNYMMASDVFVSLYDLSNVGNPLLEAMALGKAIITYDVGDTREFIKDGENGFLVSESELINLGKKMEILAKEDGLRRQFGSKASEFAQSHFWDWNHRMKYEIQEVRTLMGGGAVEKQTM